MPFGGWYGEPKAISNAIGYAAVHMMPCVYDGTGNLIDNPTALLIVQDGLRCGFVQFCTTCLRDPHEAVRPIVWVNVEPHNDASRRNA